MRAFGTSKVLSWRWAPCVALALGACCFSAFAMLVIPERIGRVEGAPGSAAFRFDSSLASTQSSTEGSGRSSDADSGSGTSAAFSSLPSNQASHSAANLFPKRGFTPPLERPEPPPAPPPAIPPQPVLEMQLPAAAVPVPPPAEAPAPAADAATADPQLATAPTDGIRRTE